MRTIKSVLHRVFNKSTFLKVEAIGSGTLKCKWHIGRRDRFRLIGSKSDFIALRIFDCEAESREKKLACTMKEIEVSGFNDEMIITTPMSKGLFIIELGGKDYRGNWEEFTSAIINLGERNITSNKSYAIDNESIYNEDRHEESIHEIMYKLSRENFCGGSERIHSEINR